jgi:enamine deaminase RidA (YjgF/YER057c/UK114 family)
MAFEQRVYSGTRWEKEVAYCRARRAGALVFVAGTTATGEDGGVVGRGSVHAQSEHALRKIERALVECGASLANVVRTRTFLTDISRFDEFARAHRAAFEGIDPVATCVEVRALAHPDLLVEIEVDAVIPPPPSPTQEEVLASMGGNGGG